MMMMIDDADDYAWSNVHGMMRIDPKCMADVYVFAYTERYAIVAQRGFHQSRRHFHRLVQ